MLLTLRRAHFCASNPETLNSMGRVIEDPAGEWALNKFGQNQVLDLLNLMDLRKPFDCQFNKSGVASWSQTYPKDLGSHKNRVSLCSTVLMICLCSFKMFTVQLAHGLGCKSGS